MIVTVSTIHTKFNAHQTLIKTIHHPHWIERVLTLGFLKRKNVDYLGSKTVWYYYPGMKPVTNQELLEELQAIELKGRVIRGASKHTRTPVITLKR